MTQRANRTLAAGLTLALLSLPASAQQSASFRLTEHVLNAGGHPTDGVVAASTSYRVTLDALGQDTVQDGLNSASFRMDASFASPYPPPGEVSNLFFSTRQVLQWDVERSRGVYNLYRDSLSNLSDLSYGLCEQPGLPGETATDPDQPPPGDAYFYLVTVENRLGEEGTKGFQGDAVTERQGTVCP